MDSEINRYSRQIILEGIGLEGQEKLRSARVLVAGAGGLGCPALSYLTAAGVGTLGIADFDTVTLSNLNRQTLHHTEDIGRRKVDSAAEKLRRMNPALEVIPFYRRVTADNAADLVRGYDVVLDCTDNFTARYLLSDSCYFEKVPIVEGAAVMMEGILMTVIPGQTPCYRCLYPMPPADGVMPTCSDTGILGAVAGVIGSLQALEAIKVILGLGETVSGRLLIFDALESEFRTIPWKRRENCPLCGQAPTIHSPVEYAVRCKVKLGAEDL